MGTEVPIDDGVAVVVVVMLEAVAVVVEVVLLQLAMAANMTTRKTETIRNTSLFIFSPFFFFEVFSSLSF
jgi:hypothetical protein